MIKLEKSLAKIREFDDNVWVHFRDLTSDRVRFKVFLFSQASRNRGVRNAVIRALNDNNL